ncbi:hypothetical protein HPB52_020070 [Rhipicephalus sanguineus]|uniref:Uncharacterized protein n=1 Tax=Rhipicephalus sanguineus TaxID=34632 RepID=A0A9D4T0C3_RHISA|nr:hypothetical protein HPB52_020070 [Rhipicephalus sanguineus]
MEPIPGKAQLPNGHGVSNGTTTFVNNVANGKQQTNGTSVLVATPESKEKTRGDTVLYRVNDTPPWYLCLVLGFQHYLTMMGGTVSYPFLLAPYLCIAEDDPARAQLISTILFVSGLGTLLQATLGVRLPVIQAGTPFYFYTSYP